MSDYIRTDIKISPFNEDAADLLAASLADIGYESFETDSGRLSAYVQAHAFSEDALKEALNDLPFEVSLSWTNEFIPHTDWNAEWEKNYFQPMVLAGGRCVVHSTFHQDFPQAEMEIVIDPKMAFGTGHHATTTMMVDHLFSLPLKGKKVVDMGTGTGILAIIAKKLGAASAVGIEIDPGAYENALENVALNGEEVEMRLGDVRQLDGIGDVDVFLANINRNIILADLSRYVSTLSRDGVLVLSGFYLSDVPLLERALSANGLTVRSITEQPGSWTSLLAIRP